MEPLTLIERLAIASLAEQPCPPPEHLAAFTLDMLNGTDHLIVAAHVRNCPLCSHDVEVAGSEEQEESMRPRWRVALARLISLGLSPEGSFRAPDDSPSPMGSGEAADVREYRVADISIAVTIVPLNGDRWRISASVEQANVPLAGRKVTLRAGNWRRQRVLSSSGFCTFDSVPAGRYTLSIAENRIYVQIRDLVLGYSEA